MTARRRPTAFTAEDFQPLADHLAQQPTATVTLTFAAIEALIGKPLPPTAATYHWWRYLRRHGRFRLLTAVGWQVGTPHVSRIPPTVTFVKTDTKGEVTP